MDESWVDSVSEARPKKQIHSMIPNKSHMYTLLSDKQISSKKLKLLMLWKDLQVYIHKNLLFNAMLFLALL